MDFDQILAIAAAQSPSGAAAPAGPINYVTNGTFTGNDATGWAFNSAATVSGDKIVVNNTTGSNKSLAYTFPVAPANGLVCTVSFDVSGFVANGGGVSQSISVCSGTNANGPLITGNGTYTVTATSGGINSLLVITARNNMSLSIDNVQVVG